MLKRIFKIVLHFLIVLVLTIMTQIGGVVYLISLPIKERFNFRFKGFVIFIGLYFFATLSIVPVVAPFFGREKVTHTKFIQPTNFITVLLNRNYVKPELNEVLAGVEMSLIETDIRIHYLDANFPFINDFPLLPHLSHNDGEKIDISLIYETSKGVISPFQKSISGYGEFESPKPKEFNQIKRCKNKGYFQYDFPKYLTFGSIHSDLEFSEKGTKLLIQSILKSNKIEKIFIEPHLKNRMNLSHSKIRYHGCGAVRHDDHIHIQL